MKNKLEINGFNLLNSIELQTIDGGNWFDDVLEAVVATVVVIGLVV